MGGGGGECERVLTLDDTVRFLDDDPECIPRLCNSIPGGGRKGAAKEEPKKVLRTEYSNGEGTRGRGERINLNPPTTCTWMDGTDQSRREQMPPDHQKILPTRASFLIPQSLRVLQDILTPLPVRKSEELRCFQMSTAFDDRSDPSPGELGQKSGFLEGIRWSRICLELVWSGG